MGLYYCSHVVHAAIAEFQSVFVADLVELVFFREVVFNEGQELFADVCADVFAVGWVEPCNVPLSFMLLFLTATGGGCGCVCELRFVSSILKCFLVFWFGVIEDILTTGNVGQAGLDGLRYSLCDDWWVI